MGFNEANWANADYARSKSGVIALKNQIKADFDKIKKNLLSEKNNEKYKALIDSIDKNWSGSDATKFKSAIKNDVNALEKKLDSFCVSMQNAVQEDYNQFLKLQSSNEKSISRTIK